MPLILSVRSGPAGIAVPGDLILDRRSAVAGRASGCDWTLPDPTRHVSSRHFEVRFDGLGYVLVDASTNGTFLARTGQRLAGPHRIANADVFTVGPFTIAARIDSVDTTTGGADAAPAWQGWQSEPDRPVDASRSQWGDGTSGNGTSASEWDAAPSPAPSPVSDGWSSPPAPSPGGSGGWQPQTGPSLARPEAHRTSAAWSRQPDLGAAPAASGSWAPTAAGPAQPVASAWDTAAAPLESASAWSSAAPDRPPAPSPDDLWGRIAEGNVVDWARGGFGQPIEPARDPLGLSPSTPPSAPSAAAAERPAPPATPRPAAPAIGGAFLAALNLDPAALDDASAAEKRAGGLFRKLVAGLVVMLEARARAKAQLGAEATAFSPGGHNPLKFARTPDEAILMLIGPVQPGFMPSDRAVEDAFEDLQSHQVATLRAMQGALRTTLERFSPSAIRARAKNDGLLERIVPAARDAALWQAYEREFGGVAQGSDEAFLDMFAKEFRDAYNEQQGSGRRS